MIRTPTDAKAAPLSEDPSLAGKTVFRNGESTAASAVEPGDQLDYVLNLGTGDRLSATSGTLNLKDQLAAGHSGVTVPDLPAGWTNPVAAVPGVDTTIGTYDLAANQPGNATGIGPAGALMTPAPTSNSAVGTSTLSLPPQPGTIAVSSANQDGWIPYTYYNGNGRQDMLAISHKSYYGSCFVAITKEECGDLDQWPPPVNTADNSGPNNTYWRAPSATERSQMIQAGDYLFYTNWTYMYCVDVSGDVPVVCEPAATDLGWQAWVSRYDLPGYTQGAWRVDNTLYAYYSRSEFAQNVGFVAWDLTPTLNGTGLPVYLGAEELPTGVTGTPTSLYMDAFRGIPWTEVGHDQLIYATDGGKMICLTFDAAPTPGNVVSDCSSGDATITYHSVPGDPALGFVTPMVDGWVDAPSDNPDPVGEPIVIAACVWAYAGTMVACYDENMAQVPMPTLAPTAIISGATETTLVPHTNKLIYIGSWMDDSSIRCFDTQTGESCGAFDASPANPGNIVLPYGGDFYTDNCLAFFGDGSRFSFVNYTTDADGNFVWTAGCPSAPTPAEADFKVADPSGQYCSPSTGVGDWENLELSNIPVTTDSTIEFYDSADTLLASTTFSNATAGGSVTVPIPPEVTYANDPSFTARVIWSATTSIVADITYTVTITWTTTDGSGPQACFQAQLTACPVAGEALNTMGITSPTVAPFAATPFTDVVSAPVSGAEIGCDLTLSGNVFRDANGDQNSVVDGTGTNLGGTLFVTLLDASGNVVASVPVAADGSYTFTDVVANTSYSIQLSTTDETAQIGSPPSGGPALPTGLANTGEHVGAVAGNDGSADGRLAVSVGSSSVIDANFGIQSPPTATDVSAPVALNPDGTTAVAVPALAVADPEDTVPTTIIIRTLPANATLFYDEVRVTAGQEIVDFDPAKFTVDPADGSVDVVFDYSTRDAAGAESAVATATLPFVSAAIELVKFIQNIIDNGDGITGPGDTVVYAFQVTNRGDTVLENVMVSDPTVGINNAACVDSLAVGTTATCPTHTRELTEANVLAGGVENRATATGAPITADGDPVVDPNTGDPATVVDTSDAGTAPNGSQVTNPGGTETPNPIGTFPNDGTDATEDPTTVTLTPSPSISLIKSSAGFEDVDNSGDASIGDRVLYTYVVRNTGNITVSGITLTDDNAVVTGGTLPSLGPGASDTDTYRGVHTIDQGDLDAGGVENTATVQGVGSNDAPVSDVSDTGTLANGSPVALPESTETPNPLGVYDNDPLDRTDDPTTVTFATKPSISVVKWVVSIDDADNNGPDIGDTIHYGFAVTNTGNVTLEDVTVTDDTADEVLGSLDTLGPSATDTTTFTATHVLTDADIVRRGVENTATASGTNNATTVTDVSDTASAPDGSTVPNPAGTETPNPLGVHPNTNDAGDDPTTWSVPTGGSLELVKAITSVVDIDLNGTDAGDTVNYTFAVTNTGSTALHDVVVTDDKLTMNGAPIATMLPGAVDTTTFTGTYVLTDEDILAGGVENTALVTGLDPARDPVTDTSDAGTSPDGTLVIDPGATETPNPLGEFDNDEDDSTEDPTTLTLVANPKISLEKSVASIEDLDDNGIDAGDLIHYAFKVTNEGNLPLSDVRITDPIVTMAGGPLASLPVASADSTTFTATYRITDEDIMAGGVENTATVRGTHPGGAPVTDVSDAGTNPDGADVPVPATTETPSPLGVGDNDAEDPTEDPTTTLILANPKIEIVKSVANVEDTNGNGVGAGDVIHYEFRVTNTGNVRLTNVTVTDDVANVTGGPVASLAAGASTSAFTGTHVLTQAEVDAGGVENTAMASGGIPGGGTVTDISDAGTGTDGSDITDPGGTETPSPIGTFPNDPDDSTEDPTTTVVQSRPAIRLVKSFDSLADTDGNGLDAGDLVTYRFVVSNVGNVTLTNVTVADPKVTVAGGPLGTLAVGVTDSTTFVGTYVVTQADLDADAVENTATATGTSPTDVDITDTSDAGTSPDGTVVVDPGTTETPNPVGEFPNDPDDATEDPTTVGLVRTPKVQLVKSVSSIEDVNEDGIGAGDIVHYRFTVTNIGNVGITQLVVTDPKLTVNGGPLASLAMGASDSTTFSGQYTLTEADVVAGGVENSAKVEATGIKGIKIDDTSDAGTNPDGTVVVDPSTAETPNPLGEFPNDAEDSTEDPTTVTIGRNPSIRVIKSIAEVQDPDGNGVDAGDTIRYKFSVTNTGNVTLSDVKVTDPTAVIAGGPLASLSPGQTDSTTFAATYVVTAADVEAGMIENVASATGTDPKGTVVTSTSDTGTTPDGDEIPDPTGTETPTPGSKNPNDPEDPGDDPTILVVTKRPELTVQKSVVSATADSVIYQIDAKNTGNLALTNVTITDAKLNVTDRLCAERLEPQATCSITLTYAIVQADRDAGKIINTAIGTGVDPSGNPVSDDSDTGTDVDGNPIDKPGEDDTDGDGDPSKDPTVFDLPGSPSLRIEKEAISGKFSEAGETIEFKITVTNDGDVTIADVLVVDSQADSLDCPGGNPVASLEPDATLECVAKMVTTEADVAAGEVVNVAEATGKFEDTVVSRTDSGVSVLEGGPPPSLALTGAAIIRLLMLTGVLISCGMGLVVLGRRRRNSEKA